MKRHAAGHAHDRDRKRKRSSSISKQSRVSQACKACASSKLKCDEDKPCRRCRERHLACDWQDILQQTSPGSHQDTLLEISEKETVPVEPMISTTAGFSPFSSPLEFASASALMTPGATMQDTDASTVENMASQPNSIESGGNS